MGGILELASAFPTALAWHYVAPRPIATAELPRLLAEICPPHQRSKARLQQGFERFAIHHGPRGRWWSLDQKNSRSPMLLLGFEQDKEKCTTIATKHISRRVSVVGILAYQKDRLFNLDTAAALRESAT